MIHTVLVLAMKLEFLVILFSVINSTWGRRYAEPSYYPEGYYESQQLENIKTALSKLEHSPKWVNTWPDPNVKLGQVSGVALDNSGRLLVFHRANNKWDVDTFSDRDVYQGIGEPPIQYPTVLVFNDTGELVDAWGQNLFYMPHGITVDHKGNVFVTDVALHQVFKFNADKWQEPSMVLGEKFVPGNDEKHFCKPSAVAVLSTGDFFVADGYCNHRIVKFAPDGSIILEWGRRGGEGPFSFNVPHALALAEDRGLVLVADRERGRVACFRADNGTYVHSYSSWLIGPRVFSVAYAPAHGGRLYIVNGPNGLVPVRGYVIEFSSGVLIQTFAPEHGLANPHDVVTTPDGSKVYVAELNPYRVYKFVDESLRNQTKPEVKNATVHLKPTAIIESGGVNGSMEAEPWKPWRSPAAGAAVAVLGLGLSALLLVRAANRARRSVTRRRWEYGQSEFKLRRLLERRRFTRVHSDDSDEEPSPMLPHPPANA